MRYTAAESSSDSYIFSGVHVRAHRTCGSPDEIVFLDSLNDLPRIQDFEFSRCVV